jgi:sugar lactone lactonase YvrE
MLLFGVLGPLSAEEVWLPGKAYKLPSEYTNQESGYFSIIEGKNGKLYLGSAKYGVNGYLVEFDPKNGTSRMVMDVMKVIKSDAVGFAAQAKIHTRNNVGESGIIYVGSKQGYPEKGESRDLYPGGYVLTHDPKTGINREYGIAKPRHGIASVMPDERRNLVYLSTCSDDRPIDHTHFMILDLKTGKYQDLGDMEQAYAFIVLDPQGRAYHPKRGGTVVRYDPALKKTEELTVLIDNAPVPQALARDGAILNWDTTADRKTLYCVEMTTNQLYSFDLTQVDKQLTGKSLGKLLPEAQATDCRAMCVAPDGRVWMGLTEQRRPGGPLCHLVSYTPGDSAPRDHGAVKIANPDFTTFVDEHGKPKPWHHTIRKEKDGTLTPWQPLGIAASRNGKVYLLTIAPWTLIEFDETKIK